MGQACCRALPHDSCCCFEWVWELVFNRGALSQNLDSGISQVEARRPLSSPGSVLLRNYGVFLNHGGPDVRKDFVDHLYESLKLAGVESFVDYEELRVGEDAWDTIVSAIHHSKVHLAIFSPGYADSSWCLNELCEMLECQSDGTSDLFISVLYNVTPGDLRSAMEECSCFFSAFHKLRRQHSPDVVEKWRKALYKASMISGRTLSATSGFEARLVKLIVTEVLNVLNKARLVDGAKHLVGVNEKLQEALHLMQIDIPGKGVNKLGIYGMGGVGKTTLAKAIYNGIYSEFEGVSFVHNVRAEAKGIIGLQGLQERMLRALLRTDAISVDSTLHGKQLMKERLQGLKVMIILDDVDDREQLEELLPPHGCDLQDGSQIVITTRDEQIIIWADAQQRLLMEGLSHPHAHLLFSWHAFLGREEPEEFRPLANTVIKACQGLPLALEVLGSHLYSKDAYFWAETVKVLESQGCTLVPAQQQVTSVLKISFDGLSSHEEKLMFLDIACLLLGEHEDRAKRIWRESGAAVLCLENLRLKSLVKVDQNKRLTMHDLLRDMGREIVENNQSNIWQRSHLWNEKDACSVLRSEQGTHDVRGLGLNLKDQEEFDTRAFAGMSALQLLVLSNAVLTGDFSLMPKELRWFQWRYCSLESLPLKLGLENVTVLDLMGSKITSLSCDLILPNLTELNLSECSNLKELPEGNSCFNSLKMLDLGGCVRLERLPDSVRCSSSLRHLNISNCKTLRTLPDGVADLRCLNTLLMNHCSGLTKLPAAIGQLTALREIGLDRVALRILPQSFGDLNNLISLQLRGCFELLELPSTIGNLRKLSSLVIHSCPLICDIPQGASNLTNLVQFEVSYCKSIHMLTLNVEKLQKLETFHVFWNKELCSLPPTISQLKKLASLKLANCNIPDGGLPNEYSALSSLYTVFLQYNPISRLPTDFWLLPNVQVLELHHCQNLGPEIPCLPITLTSLDIGDCERLERIPCLSTLKYLRVLVLCNCTGLVELAGLQCLGSLSELNISGCKSLKRLPDRLKDLTSLKYLYLAGSGVSLLQDSEPWVQKLDSLEMVSLYGEEIPDCFDLSCKREIAVIKQQHANECCMEVGVQEAGDVKGVLCCFVSHDQGWSDTIWAHGRYGSTHSCAEVQVYSQGSGNKSPKFVQPLFINRHADRTNQLHISIFGASHPFVATLRGGDTIRIIAKSRNQCWEITVSKGAVKLMYRENELQETLLELSRQAKTHSGHDTLLGVDWRQKISTSLLERLSIQYYQ